MARKNKAAKKAPINLPPFPWEVNFMHDGRSVRSARPRVEQADVIDGCEIGPDDEVVARKVRIWRTALPPIMKTLNLIGQAAMLDYAEAYERVGASGGTSDPSSTGGGCAGSKSPSLGKLIAAERLSAMHAALDGQEVLIELTQQTHRNRKRAHLSLRDLVGWVAVEGLSRSDILKRIGASPRSEVAQSACVLALTEAAHILAVCCGYVIAPYEIQEKRSTPSPARIKPI